MFDEIKNLILEYVEPDDEITEESGFRDDLGMTSFDLVCFCSDIDERFGVYIGADDIRKNATVGKLTSFVEKGRQVAAS